MINLHVARHQICRAISWLSVVVGILCLTSPTQADMAAAQNAIKAGNFSAAGDALRPLATGGDSQAQYQLAALALDGHAVGLTPEQAISLLAQAAALGNAHAQARLGIAYANGDHVTPDPFAAYHWLGRASASPDLTSEEREQVANLRETLLQQLAPKQGSAANNQPVQPAPRPTSAADKALAANANTAASVPMFEDKPLPQPTDDAGDAAPTASKKAKTPTDTLPTAATQPRATQPATTKTRNTKAQAEYFLQMSSVPQRLAAEAEATRLAKKFADILQGAKVGVRAFDLGSKGITQRVVAGPYDSLDAAKDRCARLVAQKQPCRVIPAN